MQNNQRVFTPQELYEARVAAAQYPYIYFLKFNNFKEKPRGYRTFTTLALYTNMAFPTSDRAEGDVRFYCQQRRIPLFSKIVYIHDERYRNIAYKIGFFHVPVTIPEIYLKEIDEIVNQSKVRMEAEFSARLPSAVPKRPDLHGVSYDVEPAHILASWGLM